MVRQQRGVGGVATGGGPQDAREAGADSRGRARTREENNINNNMDSSRKSRYILYISNKLFGFLC